jgi:hypothetical protein
MRTKLLLSLLLGFSTLPAAAGAEMYRYETDEGTVAFTDDLKRVPSRYRASAETLPTRSFWDYSRLTIVPRGATTEAGSSLAGPQDLAAAPEEGPTSMIQPPEVHVELSEGVSTTFQVDPEAPIEVHREYRWLNGRYTPHTIVRQGDRILAVRVAAP